MSGHGGAELKDVALDELLEQHEPAWRVLLDGRQAAAPFLDSSWLRVYRRCAGSNSLRTVAALEKGRPVAISVLEALTGSSLGFPVRLGVSPTFDWLSRYEFVAARSRSDLPRAIWRRWLSAGCFDEIRVELVAEDSETYRACLPVAHEMGWTAMAESTCRSPWLPLPDSIDALEANLKTKFRANLRNRERRLAQLGRVDYEVVRASAKFDAALGAFYQLESSGWKGQGKTSIAARPDVRRFYDALVAEVPEQIWVPILRLNDRPIAAQLIRIFGDTVYLLKVGFDEEFAPYSPGQLITARTLAYSISERMRIFDFLGEQMGWKMDWNPELRTFCRLVLCSPQWPGRVAWWSRYGYREALKHVPGVRSLARRLRGRR